MQGPGMLGRWLTGAALLLAVWAPAAQGQQGPLSVRYENVTQMRDSVRSQQQTSSEALPGDTLRYVLTFTNAQGRELRNVVFTNPIPAGLTLLAGTVMTSAPSSIAYSIDGGVTYSEEPMVTVTEGGREVRRPATAASYTHIRWTVAAAVAPNAGVTAEYQVQVSNR
jgi:uncharacterized repeat protein (TIGR01451 family)